MALPVASRAWSQVRRALPGSTFLGIDRSCDKGLNQCTPTPECGYSQHNYGNALDFVPRSYDTARRWLEANKDALSIATILGPWNEPTNHSDHIHIDFSPAYCGSCPGGTPCGQPTSGGSGGAVAIPTAPVGSNRPLPASGFLERCSGGKDVDAKTFVAGLRSAAAAAGCTFTKKEEECLLRSESFGLDFGCISDICKKCPALNCSGGNPLAGIPFLGKYLAVIVCAETWIRVALFIFGAISLFFGIRMLGRGLEIPQTVGKVIR